MMNIREVQVGDLETVKVMIEELEELKFDSLVFEKYFISNLNDPNVHYYIVENQNQSLGFLGMRVFYPLHHCEPLLEITELIVMPGFRNQKIGELLIKFAVGFSKTHNCSQIELSSNLKRTKAHAFYIRNGFTKGHFKFSKRL
jgi:(aminoalkyl)phosphonate N-acetyltransferase